MTMKKEIVEKTSILVTTAFGLIAALAWNDAIRGLFEKYPVLQAAGPWVYAVTVTIIAVLAAVYVGILTQRVK